MHPGVKWYIKIFLAVPKNVHLGFQNPLGLYLGNLNQNELNYITIPDHITFLIYASVSLPGFKTGSTGTVFELLRFFDSTIHVQATMVKVILKMVAASRTMDV